MVKEVPACSQRTWNTKKTKKYLTVYKPETYLFNSYTPGEHLSKRTVDNCKPYRYFILTYAEL